MGPQKLVPARHSDRGTASRTGVFKPLRGSQGETKVPDEEWIKTFADSRRVRFSNQELLEDQAFITAQVEGNGIVYSVVLSKVRNPLSREEVEGHFEGELSKK